MMLPEPMVLAIPQIIDLFYVVCTNLDAIFEYDKNFKLKNKFNISQKFQTTGKTAHHCNDILVKDDSLYVTMFSSTGN